MNLGKLNYLQQSRAEGATDRVLKAVSSENLKLHIDSVLENWQEKQAAFKYFVEFFVSYCHASVAGTLISAS